MKRRTALQAIGLLGTAGVLGLADAPSTSAAPKTAGQHRALTASPFPTIDGWPPRARVNASVVCRAGTFVIGQFLTDDGYGNATIRRLRAGRWQTFATPKVSTVWNAAGPALQGFWLFGVRGDVSLPNPDGRATIGRVAPDGSYHPLNTDDLPLYLMVGSITQLDGQVIVTGARPIKRGKSLAAYAARWSLNGEWDGWKADSIEHHAWVEGTPYPVLTGVGDSFGSGFAGERLLMRSGDSWTDIAPPPSRIGATAIEGATVTRDGLVVACSNGERSEVHRRTDTGWQKATGLPPKFNASAITVVRGQVWVVGNTFRSNFFAMAARIGGDHVREIVRGPKGTSLERVIATSAGAVVATGNKDPRPDSTIPHNSHGWTVRVAT